MPARGGGGEGGQWGIMFFDGDRPKHVQMVLSSRVAAVIITLRLGLRGDCLYLCAASRDCARAALQSPARKNRSKHKPLSNT